MKKFLLLVALSLPFMGCVKTLESERKRYALVTFGFSVLFITDKELEMEMKDDASDFDSDTGSTE